MKKRAEKKIAHPMHIAIYVKRSLSKAHSCVGFHPMQRVISWSINTFTCIHDKVLNLSLCNFYVYALNRSQAMPRCKLQSSWMHSVKRMRSDVTRTQTMRDPFSGISHALLSRHVAPSSGAPTMYTSDLRDARRTNACEQILNCD